MITNTYKKVFLPVLACGLLLAGMAQGQTTPTDSLSLNAIIGEVVQNHPLVKKAMEDVKAADAKIGFAKAAALPYADFTSSYTRIGPVSEITIPEMGTFTLMSNTNYSATFNVNQTIYDFGKTEKSILLEQQGKALSSQSVEQVKQKLSQSVIGTYFTLLYLQEAIKIKNEQLNTLNEHLRFVQKKQETGSATSYEILTTEVRISTIENQKTDLETARKIQVCQLNSLLGRAESADQQVRKDLNIALPDTKEDALLSFAMQNRDEMKLAAEKAKLADLRYSLTNAQNNPVFNAFVTGGYKNGYMPYLNDPKANFVAGVGVKIPVFDGKRNKYSLAQAQSFIETNNQETEAARRTIVNEVVECEANVASAQKKVGQSELLLKQAAQAYELAKVRFSSGVITNVELLDGATSVSESRLQLLKAKIDYTVNLYKLKSAIGERLY